MGRISNLSELTSNISNIPSHLNEKEKKDDNLKFWSYVKLAKEYSKDIPKINVELLEANEFIIPNNPSDDKYSSINELSDKRRKILF